MLDREPFLSAIYADPGNLLPRLVFADHLDDRGDHAWAEQIRLRCQLDDLPSDDMNYRSLSGREDELLATLPPGCQEWFSRFNRAAITIPAEQLSDPDGFRRLACEHHPDWYGATKLTVTDGRVSEPAAVETLLRSPVTAHVRELVLRGREVQLGTAHDEILGMGLMDLELNPVISPRMVERLCESREARRLVSLDLTHNDLDNDSVRALIRSEHLIRLTTLDILDGNTRVLGRLWGELQGKFAEGVVQ